MRTHGSDARSWLAMLALLFTLVGCSPSYQAGDATVTRSTFVYSFTTARFPDIPVDAVPPEGLRYEFRFTSRYLAPPSEWAAELELVADGETLDDRRARRQVFDFNGLQVSASVFDERSSNSAEWSELSVADWIYESRGDPSRVTDKRDRRSVDGPVPDDSFLVRVTVREDVKQARPDRAIRFCLRRSR